LSYNIIKDDISNSAIDFNEIDFKNFKLQSQKPSRELSAGGAAKPRITYSMYDSLNL